MGLSLHFGGCGALRCWRGKAGRKYHRADFTKTVAQQPSGHSCSSEGNYEVFRQVERKRPQTVSCQETFCALGDIAKWRTWNLVYRFEKHKLCASKRAHYLWKQHQGLFLQVQWPSLFEIGKDRNFGQGRSGRKQWKRFKRTSRLLQRHGYGPRSSCGAGDWVNHPQSEPICCFCRPNCLADCVERAADSSLGGCCSRQGYLPKVPYQVWKARQRFGWKGGGVHRAWIKSIDSLDYWRVRRQDSRQPQNLLDLLYWVLPWRTR